jgi:hypothetical protein
MAAKVTVWVEQYASHAILDAPRDTQAAHRYAYRVVKLQNTTEPAIDTLLWPPEVDALIAAGATVNVGKPT